MRLPIPSFLLSAFGLLLGLFPAPAHADPYHLLTIALYQSNDVMSQRVGTSVDLVSYIKALNAAALAYFTASPAPSPGILDIVVAIKPPGKSKSWLLATGTTIEKPNSLLLKLRAVPAPSPVGGPIVFCLHASLNGGTEAKPLTEPPYPPEWLDATKASLKPLLIPDGVLDVIWKN